MIRIKSHSTLLLATFCVCLVLGEPLRAQEDVDSHSFNSVEMAPLSALQLGDAALVAPEVLKSLAVQPGQAAELSRGEKRIEVVLYPINRAKEQVSIKKSLRDRLGVEPGKANISLRLLDLSERTLEPIRTDIRIEAHAGSSEQWPGIAMGAPHGDCDMYTGEIVEAVTQSRKVPSVCAYGSRNSFLGRWIDVNRPLQRRPNESSFGILPYRDWTTEAASIFSEFQENVLRVGRQPDLAEGTVPLKLYLDFHGHDLTVKSDAGESIYRNVFECMARGFSQEEVRLLKAAFDQCVSEEYGDAAPPSYWGNLPEDREYEVAGIPTSFFYSGSGARVYGVLASDVASRGIHIESPDSMRINPSVRPRTSQVLGNFMQVIRDDILTASLSRQTVTPPEAAAENDSDQWVTVPTGEFAMGAPEGDEGWSIERPQHWVNLSAYEMRTTEVTCGEFAAFVNRSLATGQAEIRDARVLSKTDGKLWCVLWPQGVLSMLQQEANRVTWRSGRQHHPVNYVTWHGAMAMAKANNASLPSEAQWEKAAGWEAETSRPFRTGLSMPGFRSTVQASLMNSGHISENYVPPSTCPVGSFAKSKSPVGCYDMSGNVWEWTTDWLAGYPEAGNELHDPTGPSDGSMKVIRGGGWDTERSTATPSFRLGVSPDQALPNVGFRLSRSQGDR
ncbi:formylglycine-generating enzyme family protein [Adhaeretor mobilis]|uniref:Serine/threonine-protein kinase pkn1 n=1 Tax=Adhaeretor mobilis TaxID=1930276 RepID=A0A517MTX7_9BACT|nr:SUMF1/EgtB/PvdO family nonheme iron enzyme [Adhaeretor mobilis]QDS98227.1 Serine/threonine-protein kinase pkn1 [Adhaeretor mobilis]